MINDYLKASGELTITLTNANGDKYYENTVKNLVVLTGRQFIASRMKETGRPAEMSHMEIGQGGTTSDAANISIETAFPTQARVALSVTGGTVVSNSVTYTATFPAGTGTGTVQEAAIFNSGTTGTMLCRTTFPPVGKPAPDTMAISWTVSILA